MKTNDTKKRCPECGQIITASSYLQHVKVHYAFRQKAAQALCDKFNELYPVGAVVEYFQKYKPTTKTVKEPATVQRYTFEVVCLFEEDATAQPINNTHLKHRIYA